MLEREVRVIVGEESECGRVSEWRRVWESE